MLKDKKILIGVSGGIAAYKIASLVSSLKKQGAQIHVIMTENACNFISPLTFETLSAQKCVTDTFDRNHQFNVEHVSLAKDADIFMVAPATANVIAKLAHGIADDMLTTTFLAASCPKVVVPAMNTAMYENPVTQDNIERLKSFGISITEPASGYLACGDTGKGKMPEPEFLLEYIETLVARPKDLAGKKVLITAGATCESMDPVRFITNHSSGKMGFALAKECVLRGAQVTIVKAATTATVPAFCDIVDVRSAEEMYDAVMVERDDSDIVIMAAAVSDYTPAEFKDQKIKKRDDDMSISLKRTKDILSAVCQQKTEGQFVCGFSMETENMLENSRAKLKRKGADMIVANNLKESGAGFGTDTNIVTLITGEDDAQLQLLSKADVATKIIDKILDLTR